MTSHMLGQPAATPPLVPSPVNLYRAARNPNGPDRWTSGITYKPAMSQASVGYSQCGSSNVMPSGSFTEPASLVWMPVVQVVSKRCSTIGWQATDWRQELTDLLAAGLPQFIEHELWTGAIAQKEALDNEWLAHSTATDITVGTPSVKRGIAELEAAMGDVGVGAQGMIHVRRNTALDFTRVEKVGNVLYTPSGNIVVPGVGYPGTDRSGAAASAGTGWIYGTGLVDVRVDNDIQFFPDETGQPGDVDRATNSGTLWAQREVLVSWDTIVHLAVHVTLDT